MLNVKNMDEAVQSVTNRLGKGIQSLPLWVQWAIAGASLAILASELLPYVIRRLGG